MAARDETGRFGSGHRSVSFNFPSVFATDNLFTRKGVKTKLSILFRLTLRVVFQVLAAATHGA